MPKTTRGPKPIQYPTLNHLIVAGLVRWDIEERQYLAHASDGTWVMVGYNKASAEKYLSAHPTPEEW